MVWAWRILLLQNLGARHPLLESQAAYHNFNDLASVIPYNIYLAAIPSYLPSFWWISPTKKFHPQLWFVTRSHTHYGLREKSKVGTTNSICKWRKRCDQRQSENKNTIKNKLSRTEIPDVILLFFGSVSPFKECLHKFRIPLPDLLLTMYCSAYWIKMCKTLICNEINYANK